MIRKIIKIDRDKCNGCGACTAACHEGAIGMVDGKAQLKREDYCDGLGDCLPACPTGAITFEEREAALYDESAVKKNKEMSKMEITGNNSHTCPSSQARELKHEAYEASVTSKTEKLVSRLAQWPCQIKLTPINAPYFNGAKLLIAADCTAYAYASFHEDFMKDRISLIGCPKLDNVDYSKKLTEILKQNDIKSVLVLRMEVPCCGGIEFAVKNALQESGKLIPWQVVTVSTEGEVLEVT